MSHKRAVNPMRKKVFFEEFESLYYFHGVTHNWEMQGMHFHKQYEIILFMSDGARLEIGKRVYQVKKGDIFFINNKIYHRTIGGTDGGEGYERYVLMFEPDVVKQLSGTLGYNLLRNFEETSEDIVQMLHLSVQNLKTVEEKLRQIESGLSRNIEDENNKIQLKLSLLDLLNTLDAIFKQFMDTGIEYQTQIVVKESENEEEIPASNRERVEQIKKYIAQHVEEKLDLDYIADTFYINRYYLSHYFKKETGFTLSQYITNQKIQAAKKMLRSGRSVTDVALKLSYNSDSHFISVFKRMTGITPKQYAKEKDGNNV